MRKIYLGILLSLILSSLVNAIPTGRYVVAEDIKAEILMGQTVAGTMLIPKGRQFQVTGEDRAFIQIELGQEIKGRIPRSAESKIAMSTPSPAVRSDSTEGNAPQSTASVSLANNGEAPPPQASEALSPKPPNALAIKGIYVGMPVKDALQVLNANTPVRLRTVYVKTSDDSVCYRIEETYKTDNGQLDWRLGGELYVSLKTRRVNFFGLHSWLVDKLFNTFDLPASIFAQRFIDSYRIPELNLRTVRGSQLWYYESPYDWSVCITPEKRIELYETTKTQFD